MFAAKNIWLATVVAMAVNIASRIFVAIRGNPADTSSESPMFWIALGLAAIAGLLQIWSIGLLFRREIDLYSISVACWLANNGLVDHSPTQPEIKIWILGGVGFVLIAVQMWAFWRAYTRAQASIVEDFR